MTLGVNIIISISQRRKLSHKGIESLTPRAHLGEMVLEPELKSPAQGLSPWSNPHHGPLLGFE